MSKQDTIENVEIETNVVRPIARVIARELTSEEVTLVSGGIITTGGNGGDGTTHGNAFSDKDVVF